MNGLKTALVCAGLTVGVAAGAQGATGGLTGADIFGEWTGTYQYTAPPQILSEQTGLIRDATEYETGPQSLVISFLPGGATGFDFIPIINDELFDGVNRTLISAIISGNQLNWVETTTDLYQDENVDISRSEYTLTFSQDLTQQHLIGTLSSKFLVGEPEGVASLAASFLDDEDDQGDGDYEEFFLATGANLVLSRPVSEPDSPVTPIPLPGAM